jgi:tight adherence protein C
MNGTALLLGLPAIGVAIGLLAYTILAGRMAAAAGNVEVSVPLAAGSSTTSDHVPSLLRRAGALATKVTPGDYTKRAQHKLDRAGNPRGWTVERLLAYKGVGLVAGAVLGFLVGSKQGVGLALLIAAGLGALGLFMPDILVRIRGEKRQADLQTGLPDAMDMLTVCVEAGMGFDAALGRVARNMSGAVAEESARVLQEMNVGKSRTEALRALADRTNVPELRSFVAAMVQSSQLGISIGDVLREQSKEMRIKRRQRAEEKAQKLQVKLLVPLIFCLLPAMFVVVLVPAGINILKFLKAS